MPLVDLPFADLAVQADPAQCRVKPRGGTLALGEVPCSMWPELRNLHSALAQHEAPRFRMEWNGLRMRVQRRETPAGPVFVVRRIESHVRSLGELGLAGGIVTRLRDPALRNGLVVFCGPPASGKTTVACAMLLARMEEIGGFTWTAENPVEYDLQGVHGKGQCYQEEVPDDTDILRVFSDTLRSGADTFYIGEIREKTAAVAAELASASGMLVVSTLHADSPQQAILKLGLLAGWQTLAQSLRAVLALRLESRAGASGASEGILRTQPLFLDPRLTADEAIRAKIREGNVAMLVNDIEQQRFRLLGAER